jgi:hypothetical protein
MVKAAILIRDPSQQYEGLMTSMGLQLNGIQVKMFVLQHEIAVIDEAYHDNMIFFDDMGGERFSDNQENVEKYGFTHANLKEMAAMIKEADHVVPF